MGWGICYLCFLLTKQSFYALFGKVKDDYSYLKLFGRILDYYLNFCVGYLEIYNPKKNDYTYNKTKKKKKRDAIIKVQKVRCIMRLIRTKNWS